MRTTLRLFAAAALLVSTRAFADAIPDCDAVVWSAEHGHYHCVDDARRYTEVRYYDPRPAPSISVNLAYNAYPWRYHGGHWAWYAPRYYGPVVFIAPRHVYRPCCRRWW
jgi:hypothetical protein